MKLRIFCRCSLFPSWSGEGLISTPVLISDFHHASLLSVTFINQLMHSIITVIDVKILLYKNILDFYITRF